MANEIQIKQPSVGDSLTINGSIFTVATSSDGLVTLVGKRGGEHTLVRNIHSGRWSFLRNGTREERMRTVEQ